MTPNTQPPQVPPPGYYSPAEDEISLIELWNVLARRWWLIAATTLLATLIAIVYALTAPPLYRATAYFLPPTEKNVAPFNETGIQVQGVQHAELALLLSMEELNLTLPVIPDVQGVTVDEAYSLFKGTLSSKRLYRLYFEENHLEQIFMEGSTATISKDKAVESFFSLYKINSDKKISGSLNLSAEWHDPDQAAGWVNGLSELANEMVVEQLLSNLDYRLQQQITILESSSSAMRKIAQKRREDRIVVLTEAYKTAIILGLHDFLDTESGGVSTPTYYRGSKALNAEIDILRNRSSDDPFIDELRDLEEELIHRKSINNSDISIKAYTLDQSATSPKQPIKPKRRLIVTLGGIIGLMGGVFLAFLLNFIQNQKNRSCRHSHPSGPGDRLQPWKKEC